MSEYTSTYKLVFSRELDGEKLMFQVYRDIANGSPRVYCRLASKVGNFTLQVPLYASVISIIGDQELYDSERSHSFHLHEARHEVVVTIIRDAYIVVTYTGLDGSNARAICFRKSAASKLARIDGTVQRSILDYQVNPETEANYSNFQRFHFLGQALAGKHYVIKNYVNTSPNLCSSCLANGGWDTDCRCGRDLYHHGLHALESEHPQGIEAFNELVPEIEDLFNFKGLVVGGVPIRKDIYQAIRALETPDYNMLNRLFKAIFP